MSRIYFLVSCINAEEIFILRISYLFVSCFSKYIACPITKVEGKHAASQPDFAPLLDTNVFAEISDHLVGDFLGGWEVPSQCAEKLMTVL